MVTFFNAHMLALNCLMENCVVAGEKVLHRDSAHRVDSEKMARKTLILGTAIVVIIVIVGSVGSPRAGARRSHILHSR
jgi:hypothetical protein